MSSSQQVCDRAREATSKLRDAARNGQVIAFRERDTLVLAIHEALDIAEAVEKKRQGDKIYDDARALCYGVAGEVLKPDNGFLTVREREIIDRIAEWMGSRDCEIAQLKARAQTLASLAKQATNALACVAKANYQHDEVDRLHAAIDEATK